MSGFAGSLSTVVTLATLLFLLGPVVIVLIISFSADSFLGFPPSGFSLRWYHNFFAGDPTWLKAFWKSMRVASMTMVLAILIGTPAAIVLARLKLRHAPLIEALVLAPLLVSPMIIAVALYMQFAKIGLVGSSLGLVLGHCALALPFVVMNVMVSARGLDFRLEQAAMNLGAHPLLVARRVTLPLLVPGMLTGALFAFLVSFDDVVLSLFLSGMEPTLQKRMWDDLRLEISPTVAAASSVLIIMTLIVFAIGALVNRRMAQRIVGARGMAPEGR
jgi:ABC-type spermidine/putrescine transport system permease subunit II